MPENSARSCPDCGAPLRSGSASCENCGGEIDRHAADAVSSDGMRRQQAKPRKHSASPARKPPEKISMSKTAFASYAFALVAIAALAGYFIGAGTGASTSPPEAAQAPLMDLASLNTLREDAERNPRDAGALLRYANALHDAKLVDQAIVRYREYLALVPDDPDAGIDLGVCYFERQEYDAAIAQMESVIAKHPDHQLGNFNLGIVNYNAGNFDAAVRWFRKSIEIAPSSQPADNARRMIEELESKTR